MAECSLS
ncbi:hypothetical protein E2C01_074624 [Portunus trituberculatus]|nr:hypothetical protein [Portunus trituberculatus]